VHSFYNVGAEHRQTVWDKAIPPVLEVESGTSGGQLTANPG